MNALSVLIVDDSSVMRKIVDRSLRQAGLELKEVFEASNGVEALARMQQSASPCIWECERTVQNSLSR